MKENHVAYIIEHFKNSVENKALSELTYIKLGGPARIYVELQEKEKVQELIQYALNEDIPFFILGKGCNVVFTDEGYNGIIIRTELGVVNCIEDNQIYAEAGVTLLDIIFVGHRCGLIGMENLSGVPSSLGGALFGNAGAGGSEISDFVKSIEVLVFNRENKTTTVRTMSVEEMHFEYRGSDVKTHRRSIILSATLQLTQGNPASAKDTIENHMDARSKAQPLAYPSAGCVFKNPPGQSAGKLIQDAGLNGTRIGGMMISEKHGNFILNNDEGTFKDYIQLVELAKKTVKETFSIELELEHIIINNPVAQ